MRTSHRSPVPSVLMTTHSLTPFGAFRLAHDGDCTPLPTPQPSDTEFGTLIQSHRRQCPIVSDAPSLTAGDAASLVARALYDPSILGLSMVASAH